MTAVSKIAWWGTALMAEEEILGREMPTRENHGILVKSDAGGPRERERERENVGLSQGDRMLGDKERSTGMPEIF